MGHSGLNIYNANVYSMLNKQEKLQGTIDNKNPDLIVLTEFNPKNVNPNDGFQAKLEISGY